MEKTTFMSKDNKTSINYIKIEPNGIPKATLIIAHGIGEYAGRYVEIANFLKGKNIVTYVIEFIGHGQSIREGGVPMFFGENGWDYLVEDFLTLSRIAKGEYPEIPCIALGFSMGSFVVRTILAERKSEAKFDGAVIAGTGYTSGLVSKLVRMVVAVEARKCGGFDKNSEKVNQLAFGTYNKNFEPCKTKFDWLCKNEILRKEYMDDPRTYKHITPGMFSDLLAGMGRTCSKKAMRNSKQIPILFVYGEEDSVGDFGKGVSKVIGEFRETNRNVSVKAYKNSRHDIFHDNDQEAVVLDVYAWIAKILKF